MHPENAIDNGDFIKILVYKFILKPIRFGKTEPFGKSRRFGQIVFIYFQSPWYQRYQKNIKREAHQSSQ